MWKHLSPSQGPGEKNFSVLLLTTKRKVGPCSWGIPGAILLPGEILFSNHGILYSRGDLRDYPSPAQSRDSTARVTQGLSAQIWSILQVFSILQGWKPHNFSGQPATELRWAEPSPAWKPVKAEVLCLQNDLGESIWSLQPSLPHRYDRGRIKHSGFCVIRLHSWYVLSKCQRKTIPATFLPWDIELPNL